MSLLTLLIALFAERNLSSTAWHFNFYYQHYAHFFAKNFTAQPKTAAKAVFVFLPVVATYLLLSLIENGAIELVVSTLIFLVCFGCSTTRNSYRNYLKSAFEGEETTSAMHHQQLLSDKNLPNIGFGQALIWLNYRYYVAIMLYFTLFGAAGAVFYRLLTTVIEHKNSECKQADSQLSSADAENKVEDDKHESLTVPTIFAGCQSHHDVLFWLDWLPVRITSFGYMLVGHFSKAFPTWLESFFDLQKNTHQVLIDVAQKSEDIMVDEQDCTSEPCLLVQLAKRNALLILATISLLTLVGFIN